MTKFKFNQIARKNFKQETVTRLFFIHWLTSEKEVNTVKEKQKKTYLYLFEKQSWRCSGLVFIGVVV